MKAITCPAYGPPENLQLAELPDPVPGPGQVLVRIHASSVNALDWRLCQGEPFLARLYVGLRRPHKMRVVGADIAGVVMALGPGATRFKVGDEVFGDIHATGYGGFSELGVIGEEHLARKPAGMSWEEAAALPVAGQTAVQGLRDWGKLRAGQHVLITGASGGVGSIAVQVAKAMGATVTALTSPGKTEMVKGLGADHVIDRTKEDFTAGGPRFDAILDCGARRPVQEARKALKPNGTLVFVGGEGKFLTSAMFVDRLRFIGSKQRWATGTAQDSGKDLAYLAKLFEEGKFRPAIDRVYALAEAPAAVAHVASGAAKGKTIILVRPAGQQDP